MPSATPTPWKLHVSDNLLSGLQQKLKPARLPDQLENVNWGGFYQSKQNY